MLKLDEMYLPDDVTEKLFEKLEKYNAAHPEEELTAQEFSKKLLCYTAKYLDLKEISLDYI